MRGVLFVLAFSAAVGCFAGAASAAPGDTIEEERAAAEALAVQMRAALRPDQCLSTEDALAAIQDVTQNVDVQTIAAAIDLIQSDPVWCDTTRAAILSADEAAQLAMAQSAATGAVGGSGAPGVPFGSGGVGSPGGGGGSNYPD